MRMTLNDDVRTAVAGVWPSPPLPLCLRLRS